MTAKPPIFRAAFAILSRMEFEQAAKKIKDYGDFAVWCNERDGNVAVDNGVHAAEHVIRSWQVPETTARFLYDTAVKTGARNILELGTSIGYSTIWLAKAARENGGEVFTVERDSRKAAQARLHFKMAGFENITLFNAKILEVLAGFGVGRKIDLIFMDADKGSYHIYLPYLLNLLSKDGLILVDNAGNFRERMREFIAAIESRDDLSMEFHDFDNGILSVSFRK